MGPIRGTSAGRNGTLNTGFTSFARLPRCPALLVSPRPETFTDNYRCRMQCQHTGKVALNIQRHRIRIEYGTLSGGQQFILPGMVGACSFYFLQWRI